MVSFQINLDGKSNHSSTFLLSKNFNYIYKSDCDKKFIGKFPPKIGDLNLFLIFPKKQIDRSIRNHRLFTAIKKIKFYETEVSHDVNRIIVAKQITIDACSFKATGTIIIENVELFFSLLNEGLGTSDTFFYFIECLGNKTNTSSLQH
tara:strand:+ start:2069 stop:2512 length:444 start_codon:yes stop_codon:yes gene_type:complete